MGAQRSSRDVDQPLGTGADGDGRTTVDAAAKRHSPWSQVEHLLFLLGLEEHGRGAWRAIAMNFCISRTPTQVASHAQKYFLRQELTPLQRHKKRPSIHDITCASIHPRAAASDRDSVRQILQGIVREGRDIVTAGDSTTDSSASSSGKSNPSSCLPIQDPTFAQVFAFTCDSSTASNSGSTSDTVTFHLASPQPPQYPTMHPIAPAPGIAAAHAHGNMWAVPQGPMLAHAPHQGMHLHPVMYTHAVAGQPPQFANIAPGQAVGVHMWPQHQMMLGAAPLMHCPQPGHLLPTNPAAGAQHPPRPQDLAARSAAPAAPAAPTQQARPAAAGTASGPGLPAVAPGGGISSQVSGTPKQPRPAPADPLPPRQEPVAAPMAAPDASGGPPAPPGGVGVRDRGTKRESSGLAEHAQQPGQYLAHSLPTQIVEGTPPPWRAVGPGHTYPPQRHGLPFWLRPQMPAGPPQLPVTSPPPRMCVTMPDNHFHGSSGAMFDISKRQLSVALTAPANAVGPRGAGVALGSSSSSAEGAASSRGGYGPVGGPSLASFPNSGSGSIPSSHSTVVPTLHPFGDGSTGSGQIRDPPPHSVPAPMPPAVYIGGRWLPEIHAQSMPMVHAQQSPLAYSHGQGDLGLQDALRTRMLSMRDAPTPHVHADPRAALQLHLGSLPAAQAAQANVHPQAQLHRHPPSTGQGSVHAPAPPPPAAELPAGASGPLGRELRGDPHGRGEQPPQARAAVRPPPEPAGGTPHTSRGRDMPVDGGGMLGDVLEFGGSEDIVGYLLGNTAELGEAAFLDSYSFDKSGSGSGGGGSGSGSGSGGKGSGGSQIAGSSRRF